MVAITSNIPDHRLANERTPAEFINRTTREGGDQYVLACNARRDTDDDTFAVILLLEEENRRLRPEFERRLAQEETRPGWWAQSRMTLGACVLLAMSALAGWLTTPNGKSARVVAVEALYMGAVPPDEVWKTKHLLTFDMTQQEIDVIVARVRPANFGSGK